jgi:hypothetical protein
MQRVQLLLHYISHHNPINQQHNKTSLQFTFSKENSHAVTKIHIQFKKIHSELTKIHIELNTVPSSEKKVPLCIPDCMLYLSIHPEAHPNTTKLPQALIATFCFCVE